MFFFFDERVESGVIIESEFTLVDSQDTPYARLFVRFPVLFVSCPKALTYYQSASFNLGGKLTGTRFARMAVAPPRHESIPTNRAPDWVVRDQTSPEQALLYRLSGDYNPLHIGAAATPLPCGDANKKYLLIVESVADPRIGAASGFGGVILHGLSTYGFAARAVLQAVGGGEPTALRYFGVRFTAPVKPGDELETRAWEVGKGPDGTAEVAFEVKNVTTDKVRWLSVVLVYAGLDNLNFFFIYL